MISWLYRCPWIFIWLLVIVAPAVWGLLAFCAKKRFEKLWCIFNIVLFTVSVVAVLHMTIFNRQGGHHEVHLWPFYSLVEAKIRPALYRTLLLNVLLFLPVGLTMPFTLPDRVEHKVRVTVIFAAAFSITIELTQLIFHLGRCETDDVIMNTIGGVIGVLGYLLDQKELISKYRCRRNQRRM